MTEVQLRFVHFVRAREAARIEKDNGVPPPYHTSDPYIAEYKFCNVNREHDRVTRYLAKEVRDLLSLSNLQEAVSILFYSRIINHPDSLKVVLPPLLGGRFHEVKRRLDMLHVDKIPILRGAYLVVPHGLGGKGQKPWEYYANVAALIRDTTEMTETNKLENVAEEMCSVVGCGDFFANQVCADLRYLEGARTFWRDWETFVLAGPGTLRGLSRFYGATGDKKTLKFSKADAPNHIRLIRDHFYNEFPAQINEHFRDPNNLSNCFCEFDKYERAREQVENGTRVTIKKYHGNHR